MCFWLTKSAVIDFQIDIDNWIADNEVDILMYKSVIQWQYFIQL